MKVIILETVSKIIEIIDFLILVRCIISWIPNSGSNFIVNIVYSLTEPILAPIRNIFNKSPFGGGGMMIDFSPVIAILLLQLVRTALFSIVLGAF